MFNDNVEDALNVHDLRIMAQKRLPKWLFFGPFYNPSVHRACLILRVFARSPWVLAPAALA